jgi:hypothetical protein
MNFIKRFFRSIVQLIFIILIGIFVAVVAQLVSILFLPAMLIGWLISLFYVEGIDAVTEMINNFLYKRNNEEHD